jgi:carbon monoxide dehydrogenase subunit G
MKVSGSATLNASREDVWKALNDPAVLVRTIPGCQRLEETGPDAYRMTISAGVASIKGVYSGDVSLSQQEPLDSFVLKAAGAGAPGTVSADVVVTLTEAGPTTTTLTYDADAIVGGMIGGVGQRMLSGVAKKTAGEFFKAVDGYLAVGDEMSGNASAGPVTSSPIGQSGASGFDERPASRIFEAPGKSAALSAVGGTDFARGAVVGAVAALIGALVGGLLAGRRR